MAEVRRRWGDEETASEKVKRKRLEWFEHLSRMPDHRIPKSTLFGWLPQPHPRCGPKKRWRGLMKRDFKDIEVSEKEWYDEAVRLRASWSTLCRDGLERWREREWGHVLRWQSRMYEVCSRTFRRQSDKARHKCMEERRKPIREQQGAIQCSNCFKWFRSKGGLTVHRCLEF
ncbi:uncharacterized protein LOC134187449 [Corticium candelabrum]|uniref:uncharacterized protein LOC134187449 n=1 Tax=Corticium candelabrum TaxID=121492 RepID=UPI002E2635D0|nr:uncharacterized protein LOC134187449 [Corticium candelabrum]